MNKFVFFFLSLLFYAFFMNDLGALTMIVTTEMLFIHFQTKTSSKSLRSRVLLSGSIFASIVAYRSFSVDSAKIALVQQRDQRSQRQ
jgi:F0F1-type ATP synthase membrane subunit a